MMKEDDEQPCMTSCPLDCPTQPISAKMSSTHKANVAAEKCTNGDTEDLCHTNVENAPWLAIDFGQSVHVKSVTIYNRKNCWCANRTRNAEVRVTDVLPADGSKMFTGGQLLGTFEGPGTDGQVIHIQGVKTLMGR
jgi:hypothetical protein